MQLTEATLQAIAAALIPTSGVFDPAATYVGMATALTPLGLATTMAQVTEAIGTGFARKLITSWAGPYELEGGAIYYEAPAQIWHLGSSDAAQTVVWFFLNTASTAGNLIAFAMLAAPWIASTPLDALTFVMRVVVDPTGQWSAEVSFNG